MNKDRVKKLAEILQAYLAGREIEFYSSILNEWKPAFITDISSLIKNIDNYRIKPESKYHPFENMEKCLKEMQKHQPFGWIKRNGYWYNIISTGIKNVKIIDTGGAIATLCFDDLLSHYNFVDGTPFGILEE